MKGTVIARGKKWSVVVDLGRDAITGKRIRKWHSGYETKRAAEEARVAILSRIQRGDYVEPSRQTLGSFMIDDWLPAIQASVRPTTWDSYRRNAQTHLVPYIGPIPLQRLSPSHLNELYSTLLREGRVDGKGGLSPRSVRYIHAIVHRALNDAVRWNQLTRNPATASEPPRGNKTAGIVTTWSASELRVFLASVRDRRDNAAWVLAATTGMRRGEVLGLRWRDLDLNTGRLQVRQTLVVVGYQLQISTPKTAKGRRSIALDTETVRTLRTHRTHQLQERLAIGEGYEDTDLVFAELDGNPIHPDGLSKTFQRLQKQAGLPRIRFHDLRHTHATLALQAGVHPLVVSERLGHSTVAMTLDTYSHVLPEIQETAAQRIAELVFAPE